MSLETLMLQWLHNTWPNQQFSLWRSEIYCNGWALMFVNNDNTVEVPPKYISYNYPMHKCTMISAIDPEFFGKVKALVEIRINAIVHNMSFYGV